MPSKAIVIGAGPAGLTTAIALQNVGLGVEVYERSADAADVGAGLTLWPNALKALETIAAAETVRAAGAACDGIALCSWQGAVLNRTPKDVMEKRFGGAGVALHRAELTQALGSLVGKGTVQYGVGCLTVEGDEAGATARLSDGRAVHGDVVIGADGIHSTVHRHVFGQSRLRYAGYPVYRGITGFRLPGDQHVGTLLMGRGAQFGLFPMTRDRVYWFASVGAPPGAARGSNHKRALLERFAGWRDPVTSVVAATPEEQIVVTDVFDRRPLKRWSRGRVTLIGDAAHPSTPNLGQGACQAIEDAVVLASCLRESQDIDVALQTYERRRLRRANAICEQARRMGRLGQLENPLACWARDQLIAKTPSRAQMRHLEWMFTFEP
jgi:2-polyprenyl-6-methoxyphenol hydroxylase-like FAD-dependent oxidoreductase